MSDTALRPPPDTTAAAPRPSLWRAWCYLVWLSWQRQLRARQMVWIALALLVFAALYVAFISALGRWDLHNRHVPRDGPSLGVRTDIMQAASWGTPGTPGLEHAFYAAVQQYLNASPLHLFVRELILGLFVNFLLPMWSLSFATEAMGGEREGNSLIWLLTRPLPRPAIYLGKFVAMLPWSLGLTLGGFGLLCALGGPGGKQAFWLLWLSVLCGAAAFSALFFLIGSYFRRPAVVAIVYTFFLEAILGNMPGYLKRMSINFYTQCMIFDAVRDHGIAPRNPQTYLAVDGTTAVCVLLGATAVLLLVGMLHFARAEYHETV